MAVDSTGVAESSQDFENVRYLAAKATKIKNGHSSPKQGRAQPNPPTYGPAGQNVAPAHERSV